MTGLEPKLSMAKHLPSIWCKLETIGLACATGFVFVGLYIKLGLVMLGKDHLKNNTSSRR